MIKTQKDRTGYHVSACCGTLWPHNLKGRGHRVCQLDCSAFTTRALLLQAL